MRKFRLNAFDILLICVLIALIAGTCVKFFVLDHTLLQKESQEISYTMKIAGVRDYTVDALQVGDAVYSNDGKVPVGEIAQIDVSPAEVLIYRDDGTVVLGTEEKKYDVLLTIKADGIVTDSACELTNYDLHVNSNGTYYTKYCIWCATVTEIG